MDNAIAVVCEPCFVLFRVLGLSIVQRFVYGELPSHDRLPISDLVQDGKPIAFDHISRYHIQGYGGLLGEGDFFLGTN